MTGKIDAFKSLCEVLPTVLDDVLALQKQSNIKNSVFKELNQISPNLLKSLYLLSFSKYEGFDSLSI